MGILIYDEELKQCPFCGSEGAIYEDYRCPNSPTEVRLVYGVTCTNTDCIMHQHQKFYYNEIAARKAWNRREGE